MAFQPFDLRGRVALITGGNGGIGLGMAEGIAAAGGDVCIWGTNPEKNSAALERLAVHGTHVSAKVCDVADEAAVDRCFSETVEEFGRVDGCFANAGVGGRNNAFDDMSTEEWNRIMAVNLDGVFWTFRAAARHMRQRAESGDAFGRLIGTASLAAISGQARGEHYAATKGGLVSMIKALAVEYARYGVTAHTILPGWIETDMTQGAFSNDKFVENVLKRVPSRRWGQPEDFAGIAVYIMSTASSYHSAETFLIDGGYFVF
ncbi:MAG: SDR family NAD(P)-dependent oxidoreductase [Pseudomonadota bacterium]|nr:SDR family NAD(P)-dependent oxidoreductase [Pseudomonadota bacterium]